VRPELVVATIGVVFGLGFAVLTPPLAGYDEAIHFLRANQVSHGQLIATHHGQRLGGDEPSGLRTDLVRLLTDGFLSRGNHTDFIHHLDAPPARGPKQFIDFPSGAVYSPVPYAPASLLMAIGHAAGVSTLALVYLGRIGCLLATLGLLCLAVRRMPTGRWMLAAVALLPVTVFQSAMLSADGVTLALALLVVALALDLAATERGAVSHRRVVETVIATVALGFAKPPYILFALAFAIPWWRHRGCVGRALVAAVGAGFAATASWGAYASHVYVAPVPAYGSGRFTAFSHVDPGRQEHFLLGHPWFFVRAIGRTLSSFGPDLAREALAQVPLWRLPVLAVVAAAAIVGAALFAGDGAGATDVISATQDGEAHADATMEDRSDSRLGRPARAVLSALALATFLVLMVLAYVGWNAVESPRIEAFQGRYLLPLLPVLLLALPRAAKPPRERVRNAAVLGVTAGSPLLLTFVWFGLRSHFY
jgi:uncharacterized membrane protein